MKNIVRFCKEKYKILIPVMVGVVLLIIRHNRRGNNRHRFFGNFLFHSRFFNGRYLLRFRRFYLFLSGFFRLRALLLAHLHNLTD